MQRRGVVLRIDAQGPFAERGIEETLTKGQVYQLFLALLIGFLIENIAFFQGKSIKGRLKRCIIDTTTGQFQAGLFKDNRWTLVNFIPGMPDFLDFLETALDLRIIITKRSQGRADILLRLTVQAMDGIVVQPRTVLVQQKC